MRDDSYVMVRGERVSVHDPSWFEDYENHIRTLGDEYASKKLNVRLGVEVDMYPGVIEDLPEAFHRTDFDLVIGSVHLIDHKAISLKEEAYDIFKKYGLEQVGNIYYDLIKDMLKTDLFDILGHLDIYRRYGEEFFGPEIHSLWKPHLDDLCRLMKSRGVGFEINTSSLRRGVVEPMPEREIVRAMRDRGINAVTVGSDAHRPSEVGSGITDALELLTQNGIKRNKTPFLLALIGGILLWIAGATGSVGIAGTITEILASIPELAPFVDILNLIYYILLLLAGLGGITVIGGGWLMTTDRVGTGKFLIGIGAGMGLISLIIQIAQNVYTLGAGAALDLFLATAMTTIGAGILLSIAARQMAKKPE
jgi:histidinol-phosphatase (PHP family)